MWSVLFGIFVVLYWFYIADYHFTIAASNLEEEDNIRLKDVKASTIWERVMWSMLFIIHGQHMAALQREIKFFVHHPDDPKLNVKSSFNVKNPYAPDRYYKKWGEMRDMRIL